MTVPLVCVLVAFLLLYAAKVPVAVAQVRAPGGYDNNDPRVQQAALQGWGKRALAAHQNGFEGFPPFAAAVLVAHVAHGDPRIASVLAVTYVVARVAYPVLYISNLGTLRSTVWGVGFLATAALFLLPFFAA